LFLAVLLLLPQSAFSEDRRPESAEERATETPIKHVIVIIGENRTFDNVYGTYVPKHGTVANLLSKGIVHADGTPGRLNIVWKSIGIQSNPSICYSNFKAAGILKSAQKVSN
jgi:hypothetical protein